LNFFFFFFWDYHFCFSDWVAPIERALTGRIVTVGRVATYVSGRPMPPDDDRAPLLQRFWF
jgi:hypothetical protein